MVSGIRCVGKMSLPGKEFLLVNRASHTSKRALADTVLNTCAANSFVSPPAFSLSSQAHSIYQ